MASRSLCASRFEFCGDELPHNRHEYLRGPVRYECAGLLFDGTTPLCKADIASVCTCDENDLPGRCPRRP